MNRSTHSISKPILMVSVLLGGLLLTSCSSGSNNVASREPISQSAPAQDAGAAFETQNEVPRSPRASPQLIRKAALTLIVNSLDKSIQQVLSIIRQQQGDLLGLEDKKPIDSDRHTVSIPNPSASEPA